MGEMSKAAELVSTPTLDEVMRRRADLYQAILALEQAAARPAVDLEDAWIAGVVEALGELQQEIDEHIEITERPDGLYAEIEETVPRLTHRVRLLRDEHPEMRRSAAALQERLDAEYAPGVEEIRDEVQRLLGKLVKHRQHGADLLWEAYSVDTGGAE